ncbi:unnamed protein product [Cuscuta epithymum]|uniref:Uncharacterized protein n=1 Tax=Cuscuta epithymum TaxID=186058 RepID=A0AAV0F8X1_9ASTE|nr:unnamed protein product [Cuscuta epithymum]
MAIVAQIIGTDVETFALFLLTVPLLFSLWRLFNGNPFKSINRLPPRPFGFPVVGYLPFLRSDLHHQFTDLAGKYGPIFKLQLGSRLCMVVSSPSLVKEILRDQDAIFTNRHPTAAARIATYGGRDIAFAPLGNHWREARKIFVREMLSSKNIRACHGHRRQEVRKAIRTLMSKSGQAVNIGELTSLTEINLATRMIMGNTLGCDEEKREKVGKVFRDVMGRFVAALGEPNISDFLPWLERFDLQGIQAKMVGLVKAIGDILEPIIEEGERIVSEKSHTGSTKDNDDDDEKDFQKILLELKAGEASKSLDLGAIKAMLQVPDRLMTCYSRLFSYLFKPLYHISHLSQR